MKAAAAELSTTASALSHRLAEAEKRLGSELFSRGPGRRVRPTGACQALAQQAKQALADLNQAEQAFLVAAGSSLPVVRLGVGGYDAYHWFGKFLAAVETQGCRVAVDLVFVGDSPGSRLASGQVDIVLAQGVPTGALDARPVFDDELGLVTHPEHPLASQAFVDPADLIAERYLSYSRTSWPGFEYDHFIRPAGLQPFAVTVVEQTSTIVEMVAAGSAVSILSRWALEPALTSKRVAWTRCGSSGLPLRWHCLTRPNDQVAGVVELADVLVTTLAS